MRNELAALFHVALRVVAPAVLEQQHRSRVRCLPREACDTSTDVPGLTADRCRAGSELAQVRDGARVGFAPGVDRQPSCRLTYDRRSIRHPHTGQCPETGERKSVPTATARHWSHGTFAGDVRRLNVA